ncbi:MAG: amidase, hydantoinase/carbamoylase family [Candidatus Aminicenantes bacterium]|nr:amidase, hydantoinase/carbamoylase family [Candidatus Aminicenantes bacterium]
MKRSWPLFVVLNLALVPLTLSERLQESPRIRAERLRARLEALGEIGRTPEGGVSRPAFSDSDIRGRNYVIGLMKESGLEVRTDPAGNIIGRRAGKDKDAPPIAIGSHLDTVPNGGKYDGALGVIAALECVQALEEGGFETRHPLEVVIFVDEEGGLIGSRGMIGELDGKTLDHVSQSGKTVREGITALGGNPDHPEGARRAKRDIAAYLELHIEQGGILDSRKIPIGIVEGIVGIARWDVTIEGSANHAGTTPMDQRRDALLAAARLILEANRIVTEEPGSQVGTVGRIQAEPGAVNVIPGKVDMSLELRDISMDKVRSLFSRIRAEGQRVERETNTGISFTAIEETPPTSTDARLRDLIRESAADLGLSSLDLPSGAGHDGQSVARIAPIAMIFIPSVGGISHSPKEFSRPEDIADGTRVLLRTLLKVDGANLDNP